MTKLSLLAFFLTLLFLSSSAFESDELLVDDEEFGIEGGAQPVQPQVAKPQEPAATRFTTTATRKRFSDSDSDSKIQFSLEHALGDSDFAPAGTFSARLKTSSHGGQTLTKLRFSRNQFSEVEKEKFEKLLQDDDFYRIRLPSNALSPPGRDYIISSVKARCLPREGLDELFVIHMEGVNILAVNYGSFGACSYPRQLKLPAKWSFSSHTVLKNAEQAPRAPIFTEDILGGENAEGEVLPPPERSFWAKYWMYLIPLGLIVMNAVTQAMNMPEEQAAGQSGGQGQQPAAAVPRGPNSAVRRR
ncbi:ER membrane protein complex subunit 10-like [Mangifera indica]|uniref:ER membrane protein complex subunit 10-like n=1 Tax=Mangifera indica TaxID=29780 RepID=UPI001CFBE7DF|nr:ER membrane protein complex subunit 10-like [Mangifera indica]